jgi:polysaccharide export outer membrane protein
MFQQQGTRVMKVFSLRRCLVAFALMGFLTSPALYAQTISPAMIAQLKSMPKAQQQALAKQYGIDLNAIAGNGQGSQVSLAAQGEQLQQPLVVEVANRDLSESDKETPVEIKKKRYGQSLFDRDVSTFAPTDNAQVPDDYRLGVGDELLVQLFGKDNEQLQLQVGRDGEINFPKLGPLVMAGLSYDDAKQLIQRRVKEQLIGVDAVVSMGRLRAINVFMAGEVSVPGAYSVSALTTVTQALFQAGGLTDIGSLRAIQVKRNGQVVAEFDAYDLLMRGDASGDVRLRSGDVVFVPTYQSVVTIEGEVKRPLGYEVEQNETVKDVLAMAGGYTSTAFKGQVVLVQQQTQGALPTVKNIDTSDSEHMLTPVNNGDLIRVMPLGKTLDNVVYLEGAVVRPGAYGWYQGIRVSDVISDLRRDLLPTVDLGYALIVREKNDRLDITVSQFDLGSAVLLADSDADPLLNKRDQIVIFDLITKTTLDDVKAEEEEFSRKTLLAPIIEKLRAQATSNDNVQIVSVSGSVKAPGTYPLGDGLNVAGLIRAAGGLRDSAFVSGAEFRRINQTSSGTNQATYSEIDLQSAIQNGGRTLQSRDHITVRETVDWNPTDKIVIEGEVLFPGEYFIQRGETLSDIINRAGGLTRDAFPQGAIFTREEIARIETERAAEFAESLRRDFAASVLTQETVTQDYAQIDSIADKLEGFKGKGRLLVRLSDALAGDKIANLEVVDGDTLIIPRRSETVTVVGEVRRQGTHSFQAGLTVDDYLGLSAGMTARADADSVYIVRADGSVDFPEQSWVRFTGASQRLSQGDTIVVPVDSGYKESMVLWRDITQIIYQGTVAIAAVARL